MLSELRLTFRDVTFGKFSFSANIYILDTRYKYPRTHNNHPFYFVNNQLDYTMAYYFAKSETIKRNIDTFLTNLLMKHIMKKLLYYNVNK